MSYWTRTFLGRPASLSDVRRFTIDILGDRAGVDTVVLVASELAANAIQHSASGEPGGQFVVHLAAFSDHWRVRVDDQGGMAKPQVRDFSDSDECGRGLALVAGVTKQWGVSGDDYARAVWADISMLPG